MSDSVLRLTVRFLAGSLLILFGLTLAIPSSASVLQFWLGLGMTAIGAAIYIQPFRGGRA